MTPLYLALILVTFSLVLGGGARQAYVGDSILSVLGVAVLCWLLISSSRCRPTIFLKSAGEGHQTVLPAPPGTILALTAITALAVLPFAQVVLLRSTQALGPLDALAGVATLSPTAALAAVMSLCAPVALFLATSQLAPSRRMWLIRSLLIGIGLAALLGFLQIIQGPQSGLRLFEITNRSEAVGPFANRNHFATLLVLGVVLAIPLLYRPVSQFRGLRSLGGPASFEMFVGFAFITTLLVATALARSRAGLILGAAAAIGGAVLLVLAVRASRRVGTPASQPQSWLWIGLALLAAFAIMLELGLSRFAARFVADPLEDLRLTFAETTLSLIPQHFPLGSGIGSFVSVYARAEHQEALIRAYANRAHNDWLEFLLEGGLWAALILVTFLVWYARTVGDVSRHRDDVQMWLVRASAALGVAVIAMHSLVDYPLRTGAIAAMFAVCCGLMTRCQADAAPPRARHRARSPSAPAARQPLPEPPAPSRPAQPANWPEAWQHHPGKKD